MSLDDHTFAHGLAATAGRHLVRLRGRAEELSPDALREAGDHSTHELLISELVAHRRNDSVVSEHGIAGADREPGSGRVWIVDPLDGTREFGEPGRSDWAVHVALAEGTDLIAGAVALPAEDVVLSTVQAPRCPAPGSRLRIAVSRSRPPAFVKQIADVLDAEMVPMGSAGAKIASVIRGTADAYVHAGGQYEWDSAAPVAVARAAGLHTCRLDGSPLLYNQPKPWLPDLLVCQPSFAPTLLAALADVGDA